MKFSARLTYPATTALAFVLGACATLPPPPTEQIAAARSAIESADVAGAAQTAPLELTHAREKLGAAQMAARDDSEKSRRLAEEALVDAQLAQAKAATARSREGLAQAAAALQSLRNETTRASDANSNPAPGGTPSPATPSSSPGTATPPSR